MAKQKARISFSRMTDTQLDQKADFIVTRMTGNPLFATPIPDLADVTAARTAFAAAIAVAAAGNHQGVVVKNQRRKKLTDLLAQLGTYVNNIADGNAANILGAGFDVSKIPTPAGQLPKPTSLKVVPNTAGTVKASTKKIVNASSYMFEYTLAPVLASSVWTQVVSNKATVIILGLQRGTEYSFRVSPLGSNPTRNFSDPVSSYVN